ncbi:non-ribosomal peptide synthase/polyketide synthase [Sorangium sp. So ce1151]|uniref:non-ribosomal peptide synthase/polyketide synthase n=1 Tax=Sorangium sp. So ce1151 TaxID=3133332 RepID=UPI003F635776
MMKNAGPGHRLTSSSLIDLLRSRAEAEGDAPLYQFLETGEVESGGGWVSVGEIEQRARDVAALLQAASVAPGARALLLYPPGIDYIAGFFGCLYAGVVAVPAYPPDPSRLDRTLPRIQAIVADAGVGVVLTVAAVASIAEHVCEAAPDLRALRWLATDRDAPGLRGALRPPPLDRDTLAFLQYTSGSTGSPKGVMLTHGNLLHNLALIAEGFDLSEPEPAGVIWLPPYHDMGLIGGILQPLYRGIRVALMSPLAFLQRPMRWLRAISHFRASVSGGPNFAFDLCVRKSTAEERASLDLSSWEVAFTGAEPVRAETLDRFTSAFAQSGFRREAWYPCYGLAEATLIVSGGSRSAAPSVRRFRTSALEVGRAEADEAADGTTPLVGVGRALGGLRVVVVDAASGRELSAGEVGEIWVAGPSVARGYWNNHDETARAFGAHPLGGHLRTGDLGFVQGDELFITGRAKDLLIIRGRNHYPQDIELTVERSHPAVRPGCCAAFSVEHDGEERLVVACEVDPRRAVGAGDVASAIRQAVSEEHQLGAHAIALLPPGTIPKTSSGKIQRRACRAGFLARTLEAQQVWEARDGAHEPAPAEDLDPETRGVAEALRSALAASLRLDPREVDLEAPLGRYGLDSLTVVELHQAFEARTRRAIPIAAVLRGDSLLTLATGAARSSARPPVAPSAGADEGPLTEEQQALWFLHQLAPDSPAYTIARAARLGAGVDLAALRRAFDRLVERHAALRTTFGIRDGVPFQAVRERGACDFLVERGEALDEASLSARMAEEARRPFDLSNGPLIKVRVWPLPGGEHALLFAIHHIVADLWSIAVLVRELGALYTAEREGRAAALPPAPAFLDCARAQLERRADREEDDRLWGYWKARLAGPLPVLELPVDRPRPAVRTYEGDAHLARLSPALRDALRGLARRHDTTLSTVLLSAFFALLHRYTGQGDLLVGVPTANRSTPESAQAVGYFVNPVPLRVAAADAPTFGALVARVRDAVLGALSHQEMPLSRIVERLSLPRDPSRSPLFDVLFVFQGVPGFGEGALAAFALGEPSTPVRAGELALASMPLELGAAQLDLSLTAADAEGEILLRFEYSTALFARATIERLTAHYVELLQGALASSASPVAELPLLSAVERRRAIEEWNATDLPYADDRCIHELIEEQAAATPDAEAARFEGESLTYAELNRRANQVAHHLRGLGVGPESLVGVLMERSLELVLALLGVMKAGGAYVPLDPESPRERLAFMLADVDPRVLLTQRALRERAASASAPSAACLCLDEPGPWDGAPEHDPPRLATPANAAYMIYTSGSTGRPKGVVNIHRGLLNRIGWMQSGMGEGLTPEDRVVQKTPFTFDVSVWEFFWPLITGACLVVARPGGHADPAYLHELIARERITTVHFVPSMLLAFLDEPALGDCAHVKRVICSGEALPLELAERLHARMPSRLYNLYGPTEASIDVSVWRCERGAQERAVPIGRPISNTQLYVLDASMAPVPPGVLGELYIGGVGLARGYWRRPDLTAERFVPDPFRAQGRLYRTGDVCRYRPDGAIEYIGRADQQVKLRGFRVELGEIESQLRQHPGVREAAVDVRERAGSKLLVAYIVGEAQVEALRGALRERLPEYMIPACFERIDALPLSPNGKLDRRRLPEPAWDARAAYEPPSTEGERALCRIWQEVLGIERAGAEDNFFDLGGHSLLAMRAVVRIQAELGARLRVRELFEAPTPRALSRRLRARGEAEVDLPIARADRAQEIAPSYAQEALWSLDLLEPGSPSYLMAGGVRLRGQLDVDALRLALSEAVSRHEALRARFVAQDGRVMQRIGAPEPIPLPVEDLRSLPREEQRRRVERRREGELAPFDLSRGPLIRACLLRLGEREHVLLLTLHHIVSDGWSLGILVDEVSQLYVSAQEGRPPALPELPVQYADYAQWQRSWLRGERLAGLTSYWKRQLEGAPPALELPTDRPRKAAARAHRAGQVDVALAPALVGALRSLCRQHGATLFMGLLSAWQVLLWRNSGQRDVVVGTPVANRTRPETERLIGLFANALALRTRFDERVSFVEVIRRVRDTALEAYAHQEIPFAKVVEALGGARDASRTPVFQVMFALQNAPLSVRRLGDIEMELLPARSAFAKFELVLDLREQGDGVDGYLEYDAELFDEETARRLLQHFVRLLESAMASPERAAAELSLLTDAERRELLATWNDTATEYPRDRCLHELFEAHAQRAPDAVAVASGEQRLTYGELNHRADRLARLLRSLGAGRDARVGLCVERSPAMAVGLLGILKAGAAYVPLDPSYPKQRLAFMLEDAGLSVLLTEQRWVEGLPETTARTLCLDGGWESAPVAAEGAERPAAHAAAGDLAYVMYTSGSTGRPKGSCITHRGIVRLLCGTNYIDLGPDDRVAQVSSISFDAATFEIWGALLHGARLEIASRELVLSATAFAAWLRARRITTLLLTTALFHHMASEAPGAFASLRTLLVGGEALDPRPAREVLRHGPPERLLNAYGPTEGTVIATTYHVRSVGPEQPAIPIGVPVSNMRVYVLDARMEPVPVGVPGELYIGGDGVARGYLNRPALTAERFLPDPFSSEPDARLYRTGDLCRFRPDGSLEFLGRHDQQVKLRGFRIELGEIEAALAEHPAVREAVVVMREDVPGDRRLSAYVVARGGDAEPSPTALRRHLQRVLPEYMIPSAFVRLDAIPLTSNGKVDRGALPAPEPAGQADAPPRTPAEELLSALYAGVLQLKVERVGIRDNFFELGGHSLMATQLLARIRSTFQGEISLNAVFEAPTVAALAERIEAVRSTERPSSAPLLARAARGGELPLSSAQQRLWFLDQLEPGSPFYNISAAVRLEGTLDVAAFEWSVDELVRRHETLRTTFPSVDGQPRQQIAAEGALPLPVVDLTSLEGEEQRATVRRLVAEEAQRPFDLAAGPLVRAALLRLSEEAHVLLFTMHHIVSDGWSMAIVVREVCALYEAFVSGAASPLRPLPIQYADYAVWQRARLDGAVLDAALRYWKAQLDGAPVLEMPSDRPRPAVQTFRGATARFSLPASLVAALKELGRREGASLFMVGLAAYSALLSRWSGQDDVVVGTPFAGRSLAETEGVVGLFVNTLALRADLSGAPTVSELIARVRDVALGAFAHEEAPFDKVVEAVQLQRDQSRTPLFQAMFVLQNTPMPALALPGLTLTPVELDKGTAKFDLTLALTEVPSGEARGELEYNTDLFDSATASRLVSHLQVLLAGFVADPTRRISDVPLLDPAEQARLLVEWGAPREAYPAEQPVHRMIEAQVARTPDALAVADERVRLTYRELNGRANRLARALRARGAAPGTLVGVYLPRSADVAVALLGVLKAGAAYVPLDTAYPPARIALMLDNSAAPVLVTTRELGERLAPERAAVVALDDAAALAAERDDDLDGGATPRDMAYVIYTSGSTGTPKGAAVEHRGLANLLCWFVAEFGLGPAARALLVSALGFDLTQKNILAPLLVGGAVCVPSFDRFDPAVVLRAAEEHGATLINCTPSAFYSLIDNASPDALRALASLRTVVLGGEPILPARLRRWTEAEGFGATLANTYGPTECTDICAFWRADPPGPLPSSIPLGKVVPNTRVLVLDRHQQLVPIGCIGEICVSGVGVGRGYVGDPALTATKFVPDPFDGTPGARLYRTGDLGRWRSDGQLEFLGRIDHQVKLRGNRIELGEVEATLSAHPGVRAAAVRIVGTGNDQRMIAYYVARETPPTVRELRSRLSERLPEYMVPSLFVALPALPVNAHGKVDYRALPVPAAHASAEGAFVPPRTVLEQLVAEHYAAVLGVPSVSADAHFFELGGHSLLATQLLARIRSTFQVEISLRAVFEAPTVAALAERIEAVRSTERPSSAPLLARAARGGELPLSSAQQRLWFLDQLEPGSPFYNISAAVRLEGTLDVAAFEWSVDELVRRHETLRTTFPSVDGQPRQQIAAEGALPLPVVDLTSLEGEEQRATVRRLVAEEAQRPFDLAAGPLVRAALLRLSVEAHVLLFTMHHIVSDGWSMAIVVREVSSLYKAFVSGAASPLRPLPIQYADYAVWQRARLDGAVLDAALRYWKAQLDGAPVLEMPSDRPRPAVQTFRGATARFSLPASLVAALKELGRREGASLFMVGLAAYSALLSRWSGQEVIVIGTPVAGRSLAETEGVVGLFVNTLALRADLSGAPTVSELIARLRDVAFGAFAHEEAPFDKVVEAVQLQRDQSRTPLFQAMFVLQNTPMPALALPGLTLTPVELDTGTAKFDLTLALTEASTGEAQGELEYNTDLFDSATASRLVSHLQVLLAGFVADSTRPIAQVPLLDPAEQARLLVEWGAPRAAYPAEQPVHRMIEAQVARTPDALAVADERVRLTYRELNSRANRLARALRARGAAPGTLVGVYLPRSADVAVALLGVLKAGAAYVPLDTAYPPARIALMLDNSAAPVLVTTRELGERLAPERAAVVALDDAAALAAERDDDLDGGATPRDMAYVIYTSGSTGTPKGAAVEHRGLANLLCWFVAEFGLGPAARALLVSALGFDLTQKNILAPLLVGGAVCVPSFDRFDPAVVLRAAEEHGATLINCTPSAFYSLIDNASPDALRALASLRTVVLGGEPILPARLRRWTEAEGFGATLANTYGPTECTDICAFWRADPPGPLPSSIPLGKVVPNTRVLVLDRHQQLVPIGCIGEICVSGVGVGRGYVGDPALTATKFVPDPFDGTPGARLYRTGDLGRWRSDGQLEFLGRIDHQVKLRGNRIELGEVEATLSAHPGVRAAAVRIVGTGNDQRMIAYYVARETPPTVRELRSRLSERLPEYMVPSLFVALPALPVNAHGKVDYRALPVPAAHASAEGAFVPPRTVLEQLVAEHYAAVLGVPSVSADAHFFELGGHSLLATQVVGRLRAALGVALPLRTLFDAPTVAELARALEAARATAGAAPPPLEPVPRDEPLPLSFAQQQYWEAEQAQRDGNMSAMIQVVRLTGPLGLDPLVRSVEAVVARHEILRTVYAAGPGGQVAQRVVPPGPLAVPLTDLSGYLEAEREAQVQRLLAEEAAQRFELDRGPLVRARLLRLRDDEHLLVWCTHHIVWDESSTWVLTRELRALYEAFSRGEPPPLAPLPVQYADYAAWQRRWLCGERLEEHRAYWRSRLDALPQLNLPADRVRSGGGAGMAARLEVPLSAELWDAVLALGRREGVTPFMTTLAGLILLLHRYTGQEDIVVCSPAILRRPETQGLIGCFLNTLALRTHLGGDPTFREVLVRVRDACVGAYEHQDLPFEQVLQAAQQPAWKNRLMFTLQRSPAPEFRMADLLVTSLQVTRERRMRRDLYVSVIESGDERRVAFGYNTDLFDAATIQKLLADYLATLAAVAGDPERKVAALLPVRDVVEAPAEGDRDLA